VADVATAASGSSCRPASSKAADKLQAQAKAALSQNNEELAREALARRAALGEQLADLQTQHQQVSEQEEKLVEPPSGSRPRSSSSARARRP